MEYRVLFVEDEYMVRQNVERNGLWQKGGFVLAGMASNGEDALTFLEKQPVDILVTDIKMPFMDGLALAGTVRQRWPDIRIIILSGYDDFAYAQRALQLGVSEYLVKPFKASDLLAVLEREKTRLQAQREKEQHLSSREQALRQAQRRERLQKLLMQLSAGILSEEAILTRAKALDLHWEGLSFAGAMLLADRDFPLEGPSACGVLDLQDALRSALGDTEQVFLFSRDETSFQLLFAGENRDYIAAEGERVLRRLLNTLREESPGVRAQGAIGRTVDGPADISISFADAQFALSLYPGKEDIVYAAQMRAANIRSALDLHAEKQIIHNLLYFGGSEDIQPGLERLRQRFAKTNSSALLFLHFSMEVLEDVQRFLEDCQLTAQEAQLEEALLHMGRCSGQMNPPLFFQALADLLEELIALRLRDKKYLALIAQAQSYIQDNFSNPKLSLGEISRKIGISSSYFSTIFRQETGQNLVEYITFLRIAEAKRLLGQGDVRTTEIAFAVGYNDPNYFSKIFKKAVGVSPREFRQQQQKRNAL